MVNDGGDDCDSLVADYSKIQDAIDGGASDTTMLQKRDVILVCPGTYFENVVVDKTVILQGVGGVEAGYATVVNDNIDPTIKITADGVKVDYLKIIETAPRFTVLIESSDNEISHNWISGGDDGIRIEDGADGNNVHHNIIEETDDDGISVLDSSGNDIHHNTITTSLGAFLDGEGIQLSGGDAGGDNAVHHNTITSVAGFGLLVSSDDNDIHHNTIRDSGEVGFRLGNAADDNSVHNNIVTGSVGNGIE